VPQRLELIGQLWDSISDDDAGGPPMPEWHREEVERRLAATDAALDPWEQVMASLRGRP
jgi:putative addiction module component (TIGR02574 family)